MTSNPVASGSNSEARELTRRRRRRLFLMAGTSAAVFLAILALVWAARTRVGGTDAAGPESNVTTMDLPAGHSAVLLTNGAVYFGTVEKLGTPFPILRDVFYVQAVPNSGTNPASTMLVKRGREWHAPDRMILNADHIVLIEPVGPDSRVAQLIAESTATLPK